MQEDPARRSRQDYERQQALDAWRRGEAETDIEAARRWLERAHRLAPGDQNLAFSLAMLRLRNGRPEAALALLAPMAERHNVREVWGALAAAALGCGQLDIARKAACNALSGFAADPTIAALASQVVTTTGHSGWCGIDADGALLIEPPRSAQSIWRDGIVVAHPRTHTSAGWLTARSVRAVDTNGRDLLGSPLSPQSIWRVEGFVEVTPAGLCGSAWHPGAPDTDPVLRLLDAGDREIGELTATDLSAVVEGTVPLVRPRAFTAPGSAARVIGRDGRDLLGSPLPSPTSWSGPAAMPQAAKPPRAVPPRAGTAVIIPVYRGLRTTLDCIASVRAGNEGERLPARIVVVDDASPEPGLADALEALAASGAIELVRLAINRGFPHAINAGLRHCVGDDVVLLNSDTLVFPSWLARLRDAAYSAAAIGTATPLSNDASIFSVPDPAAPAPMPSWEDGRRLAALAGAANRGYVVETPTAHGFCMFIRHDCLAATGLFRTDLFAQGYGEENDFTERACQAGFTHVAAPAVYVAHVGGVSFGPARMDLLRRNQGILDRLHPAYHGRVAAFIAADPLHPTRRRLDAARWRNTRRQSHDPDLARPGAVLMVTHGGGGGTARVIRERAAAILADGGDPLVLRGQDGLSTLGDIDGSYPNLRFALPAEMASLSRLLASARPVAGELHHLLGHDPSVFSLFARLGVPYDIWVHDYLWLCPRTSLVQGQGRYCGEPDSSVCDRCVAQWGQAIEEPITTAALRRRSAAQLAGAARVVVPSEDVAIRLRRHFPGVLPEVRPWQTDTIRPRSTPAPTPRPGRRRVAVVGAIGIEKGYDVLLDCARDAVARDLPLEFVVVGYTVEDTPLLATGRVFVTGPFEQSEATALIAEAGVDFAWQPSIWPETWCYALSDAWEAGLDAVVFDIGAQAERVRRTGRGWVLPLGLPAARVNDVLLNLQPLGARADAK